MSHPDVIESGTLLYELVPGDAPDDLTTEDDDDECEAYADEAAPGSEESRDGDVVCSRRPGHDGSHWDAWCREAWELVS